MLKKAGIVVATVSAGLLIASPFALAGSDEETEQSNVIDSSDNGAGAGSLINLNLLGGGLLNNAQVCPNVDAGLLGDVLGLLGIGIGQQSQSTTCINQNDNTNQVNQEG